MRQRQIRQRGRTIPGPGLLAAAIGLALTASAPAQAGDSPKLEYNRDIRPILAENCFACHGPDSAARKADLRLDRREAAVEAGAIVPKDPASSELIDRINSADPKEVMPPPETTKTLTPREKETLRRWIAEGAEYQPHWSLIPPRKPGAAGREGRLVGPQPDRPLRAGEARGQWPAPRPRGRPPDPGASPQPGPHRAAAERSRPSRRS